MSDQELANRVKRYGDGMVGVTVTREELTRLRQAVASMPGPALADFAAEPEAGRVMHFINEATADVDAKRRLLALLAFAEARFKEL